MEQIAPDPIVPTPAAHFAELRGRRVIIGVPGIGFRGDMRADNPVVQGGWTLVPVLTEQDYYRAEIDQIEVFAPLVPIDRTWVENVIAGFLHAPSLDAPPIRHPVAVAHVTHLTGRRIVQAVADGFVRNLRAVSESYRNMTGTLCIRIVAESDWYAWAISGEVPRSVEALVANLWVE